MNIQGKTTGQWNMNIPPTPSISAVLIVHVGIVASASAISTKEPGIARTPRPKSSIAVLSPRLVGVDAHAGANDATRLFLGIYVIAILQGVIRVKLFGQVANCLGIER